MNQILNLESDILARLTAALTNPEQTHPKVDVQAWPDRPASFKLSHPQGAALLVYKGKKYSDDTKKDDKAEFEVAVMARTLHEPNPEANIGTGMYALLECCVDALRGWRSKFATKELSIVSDGFTSYNEGVWTYTIRFTVPVYPLINLPLPVGPWHDAADITESAGQSVPNLNQLNYVYDPQGEPQ